MTSRLQEIEARKAEIRTILESADESTPLAEIRAELEALNQEKAELEQKAEERKTLLDSVADTGIEVRTFKEEERKMDNYTVASAEFRSAWLKSIRGLELTEVEQRAMTTATASAGPAIPTETVNKIVAKVTDYAPLLSKVEVLRVAGNVKVPTEGTTIAAQLHAEGAVITADADTLNYIDIVAYEITKLVTISKAVEKMSIDAFEAWLVEKIARELAKKICNFIINGTGTSEPQGINAITWGEGNSVTAISAANIDKVIGLLPGGYDDGAEWVMSKKTFFNSFRPLQDNAKNHLITYVDGQWYVGGYPVNWDEAVAEGEAILGNLYRGYLANLPEEATVTSQFVARENAYDFLGSALFGGGVQAVEAFVKIVKG